MNYYGVWKCVNLTSSEVVEKKEVVAMSGKAVKAMIIADGGEVMKMERVATMDYFQRQEMREALCTKYDENDVSRLMQLFDMVGLFGQQDGVNAHDVD